MASKNGQGRTKGKQLVPKKASKYLVVTLSSSDSEGESSDQQPIFEELAALENSGFVP